jgi:hypothetical protein
MAQISAICDKLPIGRRVTGQQAIIAYLTSQAEDEPGCGH